jgi:hypothetical protein
VAAGCDALLICSGGIDRQASALEAIIHAIETEQLPVGRVEDALVRTARVKERFMAMAERDVPTPLARSWRPAAPAAVRTLVGRLEHQAVAKEMARFL